MEERKQMAAQQPCTIGLNELAPGVTGGTASHLTQGSVFNNLGNRYAVLGEPRRAIACYEQALEIAREVGDGQSAGDALGGLSHAYTELGEPRRAIEIYEQALGIAREISGRRGEDPRGVNRNTAHNRRSGPGSRWPVSRWAVSTWRRHPKAMVAAATLIVTVGTGSIFGFDGGGPGSLREAGKEQCAKFDERGPACLVVDLARLKKVSTPAARMATESVSAGQPSAHASAPVTKHPSGRRQGRKTVSPSLIAAPVLPPIGTESADSESWPDRNSGASHEFAALIQPEPPIRRVPPAPPPAPVQDPAALSAARSMNEAHDRLAVSGFADAGSDFPARSRGYAATEHQSPEMDTDRWKVAPDRSPRFFPGGVQSSRAQWARSSVLYGRTDAFSRRAHQSVEASGSSRHASRAHNNQHVTEEHRSKLDPKTQIAALGVSDVPLVTKATTRGVLTAQSQTKSRSAGGQDENPEPEDESRLSDEPAPFMTEGDIPDRPPLLLEIGDPFLDTGELDVGFELPTGAVWQPRLWVFGTQRTAVQTIDTGDEDRISEWVNRLDLFANLQLTGTEKIVAGIRPLDENQPNAFTGYRFEPQNDKGFKKNFNADIRTLFAEGDFGSLFPKLDSEGQTLLDFGFTVGRQPLIFQDGILISDTQDSVGLVRNNIRLPEVSNLRVAGIYSSDLFDETTRSAGGVPVVDDENLQLTGLFTEWDTRYSTINADAIYAWDDTQPDGDGFYAGISAAQRLGEFNTTFRVNGSLAQNEESVLVRDGILVSSELSWTPYGTNDTAYFNPFAAYGEFLQAAREEIDGGGPLAPLGILFASPNIGEFGSEISNRANDVVGGALGYQAFWDDNRRNLTFEIAVRHDLGLDDGAQIVRPQGGIISLDGFDQYGAGFQFQQAIGQRALFQLEGFGALQEDRNETYGGRLEFLYQF